jgi:hypothetical protein
MPRYRIRMINSQFESADEVDYPSLEAARKAAIGTATTIAGESIAQGEPASAVEIQIFDDGRLVSRQVVTLSVAEFTLGQ